MGLFDAFKKKSKGWKVELEDNDELDDDDELGDGETIDVYYAAQIWASNGKDEDYTFGYTEEELEEAL